MVQSLSWDETRALGNRIARALQKSRHGDVLVEWMAHHVAELLAAADAAPDDEDARERATAAVLDLWGKRTSLPTWPPEDAAAAVSLAIEGRASDTPWLPQRDPQTWKAAAARLEQLHDTEIQAVLSAVLTEAPASAREWLGQAKAMTEDEAKILERVALARDRAMDEFVKALGKKRTTKAERAEVTLKRLEAAARERARVLKAMRRVLKDR
jgi:hypothetical protein